MFFHQGIDNIQREYSSVSAKSICFKINLYFKYLLQSPIKAKTKKMNNEIQGKMKRGLLALLAGVLFMFSNSAIALAGNLTDNLKGTYFSQDTGTVLVIKDADGSTGRFKGSMDQIIDRGSRAKVMTMENVDGTIMYVESATVPETLITLQGFDRNEKRNEGIVEAFAGSTTQPDFSVLKMNGGYAFYDNGRVREKALKGDFVKQRRY
ncbi:MAG: hypothetical protein F6K37_00305 [Moorea sp. SIO4E2]|uniref:hypothetical protein n=1 Tax=Moorena sp. SIO4E2 TaxID=2607826 RepID=UPI0013BB3BDD|nr:hypothetical protein [Moorena sp. SIO4E2]NEQ04491.1 hypothetical protein [Moorena sp. SIO4E2]